MGAFDRFPRIVERLDELDAEEQRALRTVASPNEFATIVFFPTFDVSLSRLPGRWWQSAKGQNVPQIWACRGQELFLLKHLGGTITVEQLALADLLTFELGEILLHSWIELASQNRDQLRITHVNFNSVGLEWIHPLIETVRGGVAPPISNKPAHLAPRVQVQMQELAYKWENILYAQAKASDDTVLAIAHEPSVPPRWFWRQGREGYLLMLTEERVIKVTEPLDSYPYGKIATWVHRSRIRDVQFETTEKLATLELTLDGHAALMRVQMTRRHADALQAIANEINSSIVAPIQTEHATG